MFSFCIVQTYTPCSQTREFLNVPILKSRRIDLDRNFINSLLQDSLYLLSRVLFWVLYHNTRNQAPFSFPIHFTSYCHFHFSTAFFVLHASFIRPFFNFISCFVLYYKLSLCLLYMYLLILCLLYLIFNHSFIYNQLFLNCRDWR